MNNIVVLVFIMLGLCAACSQNAKTQHPAVATNLSDKASVAGSPVALSPALCIPRDAVLAKVPDTVNVNTLSMKLGLILDAVEVNYGPRDKNYTLVGWELADIPHPRLLLFGTGTQTTNMIVQLTTNCFAWPMRAEFMLAHEAVHMLNPRFAGEATVLEEGLATYYSIGYLRHNGVRVDDPYELLAGGYTNEYRAVEKLLTTQKDAIAKLRALRTKHGSFSTIPLAELEAAFPGADCQELLRPSSEPAAVPDSPARPERSRGEDGK